MALRATTKIAFAQVSGRLLTQPGWHMNEPSQDVSEMEFLLCCSLGVPCPCPDDTFQNDEV